MARQVQQQRPVRPSRPGDDRRRREPSPLFTALPRYVGDAFGDVPPGHRFGLYFGYWNRDRWTVADEKGGKQRALREVLPLSRTAGQELRAPRARQAALAHALGDEYVVCISRRSEAPFMTGVGMEHPLENGFAFLSPYGLPYLPGAGVKGILRKAAEDLALGLAGVNDRSAWDIGAVWWLFGFEGSATCLVGAGKRDPENVREFAEERRNAYRHHVGDGTCGFEAVEALMRFGLGRAAGQREIKDARELLAALADPEGRPYREQFHLQGALAFWDVFPEDYEALAMDILTPHYAEYYQGKASPHDSGQPTPVPFLVVPPGSSFAFHVQLFDRPSLPESIRKNWKELTGAAFKHAFSCTGFGAKTAVGYGQMMVEEVTSRAAKTWEPEADRAPRPERHAEPQRVFLQGEEVEVLQRQGDEVLVSFVLTGDTEWVSASDLEGL